MSCPECETETDKNAENIGMGCQMVSVDFARKLERERDEARERVDTMFAKFVDILEQTRNERDDLAAWKEARK